MNILNKFFKQIILSFLIIEIFSYLGFLYPSFGKLIFIVLVIISTILTIKKLEYGVFILFAELITGSKGYLFSFSFLHFNLSIRIALFLIIIFVFFENIIYTRIKTKTCPLNYFLKNNNFKYFIPVFIFIAWGIINAFLNKNSISNIYQDANGWFYFFLIIPFYYLYENKNTENKKIFKEKLITLFLGATFWTSIKTFILLFIFSHNSVTVMSSVYRWVRNTGVGEITKMSSGFVRIFFQSHIFAIVAFFIIIFLIVENKKRKISDYLILITFSAIIILSFSRSNWIGFAAGVLIYFLILILTKSWSKIKKFLIISFSSMLLSFLLINLIIIFPYPKPTANFNSMDVAERASQLSNEAGVSSRWKLLTPLWTQIKQNAILGHGYGSTVTYFSEDPRVLEINPTGEYTTFAFEWGWLEIWLKLGLVGVIYYLYLIGKLSVFNLHPRTLNIYFANQENTIKLSLIIGLITISIISFFSPYMNHPLGIGFLIFMSIYMDKKD